MVADAEAVGENEPPLFQVGEETLVEIGFLLLVVKFLDAAGFEALGGKEFPKLSGVLFELVKLEGKGGRNSTSSGSTKRRPPFPSSLPTRRARR